jgi:hypothetical protein
MAIARGFLGAKMPALEDERASISGLESEAT